MPTYAYTCTACDHRFDIQQSFADDALSECPRCAGRVRKLFNTVGIVFKGSGFYRTDSRGSAGTPADAASTSSGSGDGSPKTSGSSGSTDSSGSSANGGSSSGSSGSSGSSTSSGSTGSKGASTSAA